MYSRTESWTSMADDGIRDLQPDISNITLVFNQTQGDTNDDGLYTIKVDVPSDFGEDPELYFEELLAALICADPNLDEGADLMFVVLTNGQKNTEYRLHSDSETIGAAPDNQTVSIGPAVPRNSCKIDPTKPVDAEYAIAL